MVNKYRFRRQFLENESTEPLKNFFLILSLILSDHDHSSPSITIDRDLSLSIAIFHEWSRLTAIDRDFSQMIAIDYDHRSIAINRDGDDDRDRLRSIAMSYHERSLSIATEKNCSKFSKKWSRLIAINRDQSRWIAIDRDEWTRSTTKFSPLALPFASP